MTAFKSDFLNILQERGFIHQCSDFEGLDALAAKGQATAYVGYDCTAPSLHIGNYLTMMMLHWLQQSGNKPITLMGGGTTMVGDPSGKDESRAIRTVEEIETNVSREEVAMSRDLGIHPESGRPVSVRMGRFGPFVQVGAHGLDPIT